MSQDLQPNNLSNGTKFKEKWLFVVFFIFLMILLPFFESQKVILWNSQREESGLDIFQGVLLSYAEISETSKEKLGLSVFFEKESDFWQELKEILIKPPNITFNQGSQENNKIEAVEKDQEQNQENEIIPTNETSNAIFAASQIDNTQMPYRFLLLGDSFMGTYSAIGDLLERALLKYEDAKVDRFGKVSSGLSRPDFFDWKEKAKELVGIHEPDVVIIMLGSNDHQPLKINNEQGEIVYLSFGSNKWREEYAKRVNNFVKFFEDNDIKVFWIGLPTMRDENYSEKVKIINGIQERVISNFENAYFISTWSLLSDKDGNYAAFLLDKKGQNKATRASDGIHLTFFAGNIIVEKVISELKEKSSL